MQLISNMFRDNAKMPAAFTGEGENISPPLAWRGAPPEAKGFALICEDPDAPVREGQEHPFVHWVIYDLPASVMFLPDGIVRAPEITTPIPAKQGKNSFGSTGYDGPMPPIGHGVHHYVFTLYAVDKRLDLAPGLKRDELLAKIRGHVLAAAKLAGTYERTGKKTA